MSQHKNGLSLWLKVQSSFLSLQAVVLMLKTREVLEHERRYSPCNYINCGSPLTDSAEMHILSLSLAVPEGDV